MIYGIFTQGTNEYYDDANLHISRNKNHICLNSLGIPFANLISIDETIRANIESHNHLRYELYFDEDFYFTLKFELDFSLQRTCTLETAPINSPSDKYSIRITVDASNKLTYRTLDKNDEIVSGTLSIYLENKDQLTYEYVQEISSKILKELHNKEQITSRDCVDNYPYNSKMTDTPKKYY